MKAPLRFAFGWVLYVAIFVALNQVLHPLAEYAVLYPEIFSVSVIAALAAFIAFYFFVLKHFWYWLDKPRAAAHAENEV